MKLKAMELIDWYKSGHLRMYPEGTELVYSNFTPRSDRLAAHMSKMWDHKVVFAGLQGVVKWLLIDLFNDTFFNVPHDEAVGSYKELCDEALGPGVVSVEHVSALHKLGYLPLVIKALPEGSRVNIGVPVFTIVNTHADFAWVTNYVETMLSAESWKTITNATVAYEYRRLMEDYAERTGAPKDFVLWQGHDFSARGMSGMHDAAQSGLGHLLSFYGTDTVPAIRYAKEYYGAGFVGGSVPACYDDQTEILTSEGFVKFCNLKEGVPVAQFKENGSIEFITPTAYFKDLYEGPMIHFTKPGYRYVDLMVTPNHKMVRYNRGKERVELFEAGSTEYKYRKGYSDRSQYIVAGYGVGDSVLSDLDRLKIAFQADGSFPSRDHKYTGERTDCLPIRFSLKKLRKKNRLENILKALNVEYTRSDYDDGYSSFWIKIPKELGKFEKGFDWVDLSGVSSVWAQQFIEEIQYWDGSAKGPLVFYDSTVENCADKVQAISVLAGYKTQKSAYLDKRGDRKTIYSITCSRHKDKITGENTCKTTIQYSGYVYCVSVPSKMLIVRRNGVVAVCGNTEHSVMCMGGSESEVETFRRLIEDVYPSGIISIVSDTWDFWKVITEYSVELKDKILARTPNALGQAKVVFRPDSGDPVKILTGYKVFPIPFEDMGPKNIFRFQRGNYEALYSRDRGTYHLPTNVVCTDDCQSIGLGDIIGVPEVLGAVECLWNVFGGTTTDKGFKVLHERVGLIYGDSITLDRADRIMSRLAEKGFASCNCVYGIGSFTYTYNTRDTYGMAIKATYGVVNGEPRELFKDPVTDNGTKKSAKGLLRVEEIDGNFVLFDQQTPDQEHRGALVRVFENGVQYNVQTLDEIRNRLHP